MASEQLGQPLATPDQTVQATPDQDPLARLAKNLRAMDVAEFRAVLPNADLEQVIARAMAASVPSPIVLTHRGHVAFVGGVIVPEESPHVGIAWGCGTDDAWRVIPTAGHIVRGALKPWLIANGVRRVHVAVLKENTASQLWLTKYMGATPECELPQYGYEGQTFLQLAWTI